MSEKAELKLPELSAQHFYRNDPLLLLLKNKLHLNNAIIILFSVLLVGGGFYKLRELAGTHFGLQGTSLLNSITIFFTVLVIFPLLFLIYLYAPSAIANLFNSLNEVIRDIDEPDHSHKETYQHFCYRVVSWEGHRWLTFIIITFILANGLYNTVIKPTNFLPIWLNISFLVIYSIIFYIISLSTIRFLITMYFTNKLLQLFSIRITPLLPNSYDKLFSPMWRMQELSIFLIVLTEIAFLLTTIPYMSGTINTYFLTEAVLLSLILAILVPLFLIGWILLPRNAITSARDFILDPIAKQFQGNIWSYHQVFALICKQHIRHTFTSSLIV